MRLFLDSSTLLAASGSVRGASRFVIEEAVSREWILFSSFYCFEETRKNLPKLGRNALRDFEAIVAPKVECASTALVIDRPMVYRVSKDRPVVATALSLQCHALLTLDRADFQRVLGNQIYGLLICTPGDWLKKHMD